jgi:hypothetical protein
MPPSKPALTLLALVVLLSPADSASAAISRLTPNPPVPLAQPTTEPASASTTPTATAIPRTGTDLPEELLIAAAMITGGLTLRAVRPRDRHEP